jgi:hypothetical protein
MVKGLKLYAKINRVTELDDGHLEVEGIATTPTPINDNGRVNIITGDAMRGAIPAYMQFPTVREMHVLWAAGKTVAAEVDDDEVTHIITKIVDEDAKAKVREEVYRGFSISGNVTERDPADSRKVLGFALTEISLVDVPKDPACVFTVARVEDEMSKKQEQAAQPSAPEITRASQTESLKRSLQQEVWDCQTALAAIDSISWLLNAELQETHAEAGSQVADLKAAIEHLKAFVVSEIQEVKTEPTAISSAAPAGDVARAGAKFSAETKRVLADHADKLEKCHRAFKSAHDDLKECHRAFGELGWKDDDKDAKDDKKTDKKDDKKTDKKTDKKDDAKHAAEAGEVKRVEASPAAAPEAPPAATPAPTPADDVLKRVAALEKQQNENEDALKQAGDAIKQLVSERNDLVSRLAVAEKEVQRKGAVTRVYGVDKEHDTGAAAEDKPEDLDRPLPTDPALRRAEGERRAIEAVKRAFKEPFAVTRTRGAA